MHSKNVNHAIEPTCRVFFAELVKSDFFLHENGTAVLVTPTGAKCKKLFGVGEVQDVETRGKIARIQLNELTASLNVYTKTILVENTLTGIQAEKKTIIAFLGTVHVREGAGKSRRFIILADDVGAVEERVRNRWILTTAKRTMERIELLRTNLPLEKNELSERPGSLPPETIILKETMEHYALDNDTLDELAGMAINAVTNLWQHYHTTTKEEIVALIKKAGIRGMERDKIVRTLKTKGLPETLMEEVIDELIMERRCYESESGVLKC